MEQELTERERKLVEYIQRLLVVISVFSTFAMSADKMLHWLNSNLMNIDSENLEKELVEYLESEYGLEYHRMTDAEIFGSGNGTQN
jgi:hypothetical protein